MIYKGFRFGMLLQLAIGPVCLFILQTSVSRGLFQAELAVIGVVAVDTSFILLAILGIGAVLQKRERLKATLQITGAAILIVFGLNNLLGSMDMKLLPSFHFSINEGNVLGNVLILTLSNPLTILFWAGVFASRLGENGMDRRQVFAFGLGAVLSTAFFLSLMALIGSMVKGLCNVMLTDILNAAVGVVLILFGIMSLLKMKSKQNKIIESTDKC